MDTERAILHVDMDAFFAAVEQHDRPELRGRPVIVGAPPDRRGVVSTCSYEARAFGVHSAMPSRQAYERCPQGIFLPPRMGRYREVSEQVFAIFRTFSPLVEPVSVDEAFLDVSGVRRLFGEPRAVAEAIRARVREETGLTCSVGVAPNRFLAKLAGEERKPDGLFEVPRDQPALLAWLGAKPIRALWGVGPALAGQLEARGLKTVRDLQSCDPRRLRAFLTEGLCAHLTAIAFGRDSRPVGVSRPEKSFSREHTYPEDTLDLTQIRDDLRRIAADVGQRLREAGVRASVARLKIRYAGFRTVTRQAPFPTPVCDDFALRDMALRLLETHLERGTPVRLIGFGAEHPDAGPDPAEDLFAYAGVETPSPRTKEEKLFATLDALRRRYGRDTFPTGREGKADSASERDA